MEGIRLQNSDIGHREAREARLEKFDSVPLNCRVLCVLEIELDDRILVKNRTYAVEPERIITRAAVETISTAPATEGVVADASIQGVVAGPPSEEIVDGNSGQLCGQTVHRFPLEVQHCERLRELDARVSVRHGDFDVEGRTELVVDL